MKYVFKGRVLHNKTEFLKGHLCPTELVDEMNKIGVLSEVPEPVVMEAPKQLHAEHPKHETHDHKKATR